MTAASQQSAYPEGSSATRASAEAASIDLTVADSIARRLAQYGIERVFGIPGTHNLELFRSLGAAGIEIISAHHEQGLGYAADAHARLTGKPAVVVTTTGPGITNLVTALATARAASVPILAIAPGIPESGVGRDEGWLHDLPSQLGLMSQLVRSRRAQSGSEAIKFIDEVARSWENERPLPAYLEIPFDMFGAPANICSEGGSTVSALGEHTNATKHDIDRAAQFLASSSSPLIIVGRGATNHLAVGAVREIAEGLGALVMTTANAKGVLDERHPLSLGVSLRTASGKRLIESSDALLVVGSDLGRSEFWGPFPTGGGRMVRVDVDPQTISANADPQFALRGRTEEIMPQLSARISKLASKVKREDVDASLHTRASEAAREISADLVQGGQVYRAFHEHLQDLTAGLDIAVAGDSSQATYFGTATFWKATRPNRFLYPAGYGTLGYALPAAIGAVLAQEVDRVVAFTGEGGMLFSVQELATIAEYSLPIITVVFVNGGYREIRDGMEQAGIAPVGVDFPPPDLVAISRGFRIDARSIVADGEDEIEFREALVWALQQESPTLISVDIGRIES
ncbi:thiamine pyrophosphate-binding protein [Leucobacter denitrificans]|uniref:Thiamine pyrophosphate-binding protein n=1 Tax=Leucobacter denitrificans TaxID=683042 RepID=A0A7G9S229_9MICO|nr:thiamine pyrophosphate-binding protein [Leucobacter denitrificans]QNN61904.1 thiamine pyrophosphate-binding protein [Leucobacter denitrificans]